MPASLPRVVRKARRSEKSKAPKTPQPARDVPKRRRSPEELVGAPLARVMEVHNRLNAGIPTTATMLAKKWGVARSTVMRDLECMRDRLHLPIEWVQEQGTYVFSSPCPTLPFVVLGSRDALILALVGRVCDVFYGSTFGQRLDEILKKLAPMLGSAVSFTTDALDRVIAPPMPEALDEFEQFFPLFDAIRERRAVRLLYTKRETEDAEERVVQPLALTRRRTDGRWLLIAYDAARAALRKYLLVRIEEITTTDETFEPPAGVDVRAYIRKSLDACADEEEHEVRVALDAHAAFYAREQPWHPSQRLRTLPDGRVQLTLRVNDLPGARHLILRWADHAEVLAPAGLRAEVAQAHRAALAHYDRAGGAE